MPEPLWTSSFCAQHLLFVDPLAADALKRRALQGETLILGRDAGIADEHVGAALLHVSSQTILLLR